MVNKWLVLSLALFGFLNGFSVCSAENKVADQLVKESKSVAWYVANMQAAHAKNKECYADPNAKDLQASQECVNSLQALKLSFAGGNQPASKY